MANLTLNYLRLKFSLLNLLSNSKWFQKRVIDQKNYLGATIISMSMLNSSCTSETKKTEEPKLENKNIDTNQVKLDTLQSNNEKRDTVDRPIRKINNKHKVKEDIVEISVPDKSPTRIDVANCYMPVDPNMDQNIDESDIVSVAEVMPQFDGGNEAMMKFITDKIKFPADAKKSGTVFVEFIVTKTGKLTNVVVKRGVIPSCDQEAIRVIKNMPYWTPGKNHGKEVNVRMVLPIRFELK